MAEAVDTFFDRAADALPVYVSKIPAMIAGLVVVYVILQLSLPEVWEERRSQRKNDDQWKRLRWLAMLIVVVVVCNFSYDFVERRVLDVMTLFANKQHVANIFWLRRYRDAMR